MSETILTIAEADLERTKKLIANEGYPVEIKLAPSSPITDDYSLYSISTWIKDYDAEEFLSKYWEGSPYNIAKDECMFHKLQDFKIITSAISDKPVVEFSQCETPTTTLETMAVMARSETIEVKFENSWDIMINRDWDNIPEMEAIKKVMKREA